MIIRHARAEDADAIAALNEVFVSVTSPMDSERFLELLTLSSFCLVAENSDGLLGFVIAMKNGAPYDNGNYQWFESRVPGMVYVDRIVLASDARGQGIGTKLYGYLAELAVGAACVAPGLQHGLGHLGDRPGAQDVARVPGLAHQQVLDTCALMI